MSVESQFYQLEQLILSFLWGSFHQHKENTKLSAEVWHNYLDEFTKEERFSDWLLQRNALVDYEEVCAHILECRLDECKEELPDSTEHKKILDVYARHYVNISLTAQSFYLNLESL